MTGGVNYDGVEKLTNGTSHPMRGVTAGKRIEQAKSRNGNHLARLHQQPFSLKLMLMQKQWSI